METQKTDNVMLTERDKNHEKLMVNILKNLSDTPLVLKGGTALYLGYSLNRFSEDLDFDSAKKLNLLNKIKASAPHGIVIDDINVKKDTDTVSRYIVNYHIRDTGGKDALKMEISYRTPAPEELVTVKDGIRFSSVERIIGLSITNFTLLMTATILEPKGVICSIYIFSQANILNILTLMQPHDYKDLLKILIN